jgi:hypothetical protein
MTKIIFFGNGPLADYSKKVLENHFEIVFHAKTKEDLEEVVNIESSLYKDVWNKEAYLRDLENEIAFNYV